MSKRACADQKPTLILSKEEVKELCRTPVRVRQIRFLVKNGIRHYVDHYGCPVVTRSAIEGVPDAAHPNTGWASNKSRAA